MMLSLVQTIDVRFDRKDGEDHYPENLDRDC